MIHLVDIGNLDLKFICMFLMRNCSFWEFVVKDFIFPCHYCVYGFNSAIFRFVDVAYDSVWICW